MSITVKRIRASNFRAAVFHLQDALDLATAGHLRVHGFVWDENTGLLEIMEEETTATVGDKMGESICSSFVNAVDDAG